MPRSIDKGALVFAVSVALLIAGIAFVIPKGGAASNADVQPSSISAEASSSYSTAQEVANSTSNATGSQNAGWTDEISRAYSVLEASRKPTGDLSNIVAEANPIGEGVFFWKEALVNANTDSYSVNCWLVVGGHVFKMDRYSGTDIASSWPEDKPDVWTKTNLPSDFRIIEKRAAGVEEVVSSLNDAD